MLSLRSELAPVDHHDVLISAVPGPSGELVALWSTESGAELLYGRDTGPGQPAFPHSVLERPVSAVVTMHAPELAGVVAIPELAVAFPEVQPLPDQEVLVVGSRSRWRPAPDGPEPNAVVYDNNGQLVRTGVLGDGINHVQVSRSGTIWVGYFDEGVFGSKGWGGPGPRPIGEPGIVCFDPSFEPTWRLADPSMADCYALNVVGETAWACYYTDFPVVRVDDGKVSSWQNTVQGAAALVVEADRVALVGCYDDRERITYGRLVDDRFRIERTVSFSRPGGATVCGRGGTLHVVADTQWWTATLDELISG